MISLIHLSQLQRIGRTGRKRTGYVHVLLSEIREEDNWEKAKDTYGEVQKSIVRGDQLELYKDVERLLPDHAKPECLEKKMDIEEYVREEKGKGKKAAAAGSSTDGITAAMKRKRNAEDMGRNIPAGAAAGFVKASELKKKKRKVKEFDPLAGEDDDTDREIEAGLDGPRRTISASAAPSGSSKTKKKVLRKAATVDGSSKKTTTRKKKKNISTKTRKVAPPTASQLSHLGADDSDDMEIEKGIDFALRDSSSPDPLSPPPPRKRPKLSMRYSSSPDPLAMDQDIEFEGTAASVATASNSARLGSSLSHGHTISQKYRNSSSDILIADDVIDISSTPPLSVSNSSALPSKPSSVAHRSGGSARSAAAPTVPPAVESDEDKNMAWLLEGDDEPDIEIHSSPIPDRKRPSSARPPSNYDDTIEIVNSSVPSSPAGRGSLQVQVQPGDSIEILEDNSVEVLSSKPLTSTPLIPLHINTATPKRKKPLRNIDMLPPGLPTRLMMSSPSSSVSDIEYPEPSFAVRPAGRRPKKRVDIPSDPESPLRDRPSPSLRRLQRRRSETSPTPALVSRPLRPQKWPDSDARRIHNPWIDVEAAHSGDDVSEGFSQVDEVETGSDQQFLQGHPETQMSPSYDQTLAYRQSLFTQAPAGGKAPVFANRPAARGAFYAAGLAVRRPLVSSSPPINRDEPNEYSMGSFVVDDDAEITYASSDT
jgi:ATP-dependent DNA helicase MPH1